MPFLHLAHARRAKPGAAGCGSSMPDRIAASSRVSLPPQRKRWTCPLVGDLDLGLVDTFGWRQLGGRRGRRILLVGRQRREALTWICDASISMPAALRRRPP